MPYKPRTPNSPPKERSCDGKQSYDTHWEATVAAANRRFYSGHDNIHPYKCTHCNHFHIGHSGGIIPANVKRRCYVCYREIDRKSWLAHLELHDRGGGGR